MPFSPLPLFLPPPPPSSRHRYYFQYDKNFTSAHTKERQMMSSKVSDPLNERENPAPPHIFNIMYYIHPCLRIVSLLGSLKQNSIIEHIARVSNLKLLCNDLPASRTTTARTALPTTLHYNYFLLHFIFIFL